MITKSITVGYDAKRAVRNFTGLGNYSRYVIAAMCETYPSLKAYLFTPKIVENDRLRPILDMANASLITPHGILKKAGSLWRTFACVDQFKELNLDLYHGLSNELPLTISKGGIPSVVTIHDVIWRRIPQDYTAIDRKFYDYKYGHSARNATRIIAISECTKRDLINDFDIAPEKIDIIYQGCAPIFRQQLTEEQGNIVKNLYNLPERYIACVGTVQSRKNQMLAIKSLESLDKDVKLVLIGSDHGSYAHEIKNYINSHNLANRVIWLPHLPFAHLPYIYALARFSAYTSRYEGFGIPVIESLTVGTPVIAAKGSCLEEAGGDAAFYVDPDDADDFISNASKLLNDDSLRSQLGCIGKKHVEKFNYDDFAHLTMRTYKKAIDEYK